IAEGFHELTFQRGAENPAGKITATKIAKIFQTFPDISTGIGRWHQSDHKHIGLSAATTGYNQTTMRKGSFHGQNCQNDGKIRPGVSKKESAKRFYFSGTFDLT
ncbi:hypothetical protein, partial [Odoribacter splanchnicus]|uniref:hypothetical protein n=1 Tax=Odoribacter splanchnicus TaxID=28118 RepID=UPI001C00F330